MDEAAKGRWRFRLVELVVVVGILALLAALVVPAIQRARESARRSRCAENLKTIAFALLNYEHVHKTFPPGMICDKGEDPALTAVFRPNWAILILGFLATGTDQQGLDKSEEPAPKYSSTPEGVALKPPFLVPAQMPLSRVFDSTVPLSHMRNRQGRKTLLSVFLCASDAANNRTPFYGGGTGEGDNWARGNYAVNAGNVFIGKDGGVVDANSAQWRDNLRRGVMAVNDATMDLAGMIKDGTSTTILAGEIRAGLTDKDRRGVWAMGMAGSSIACAHGSWGDANGPNAWNRWADDIKGGDQVKLGPAAADQCMEAWGKSGSRQATFRSLHPNGCNVVFADNSVHFISNTIETSGPWGDPGPDFWPVWDRLICSADRHPVDATKTEYFRPTPEQKTEMARAKDWRVNGKGLLKVGGTVRFKDGTIPEGQYRFVTFHFDVASVVESIRPFGLARGAGGDIEPDGRFEMTTVKPGDGVLPGHYKVTIKCLKNYADPDSLTIPKKYAEFSTTPLEVTIERAQADLEFLLDK